MEPEDSVTLYPDAMGRRRIVGATLTLMGLSALAAALLVGSAISLAGWIPPHLASGDGWLRTHNGWPYLTVLVGLFLVIRFLELRTLVTGDEAPARVASLLGAMIAIPFGIITLAALVAFYGWVAALWVERAGGNLPWSAAACAGLVVVAMTFALFSARWGRGREAEAERSEELSERISAAVFWLGIVPMAALFGFVTSGIALVVLEGVGIMTEPLLEVFRNDPIGYVTLVTAGLLGIGFVVHFVRRSISHPNWPPRLPDSVLGTMMAAVFMSMAGMLLWAAVRLLLTRN